MVNWAVTDPSHPLAGSRASGQQQPRACTCVAGKNRKHRALVIGTEVEKAVEPQYDIELAPQCQPTHISHHSGRIGHTCGHLGDHLGHRVNARDVITPCNEPLRDGLPGSAPNIEDMQSGSAPCDAGFQRGPLPQ